MKPKYLVQSGWITSANDGDRHLITASTLMVLYMVRPEECIVVNKSRGLRDVPKGTYRLLVPQYWQHNYRIEATEEVEIK